MTWDHWGMRLRGKNVCNTDLIFEATSNGAAVVYGCLFIDYNFFHFVF